MHPLQFPGLEVDDRRGLVGFQVAGRTVTVEVEDFARLLALPEDTRLTVTTSGRQGRGGRAGRKKVPAVAHPSWGVALLARLLVGATESERVSYRNGDAFDLRRDNIITTSCRARFRRSLPAPDLGRVVGL